MADHVSAQSQERARVGKFVFEVVCALHVKRCCGVDVLVSRSSSAGGHRSRLLDGPCVGDVFCLPK